VIVIGKTVFAERNVSLDRKQRIIKICDTKANLLQLELFIFEGYIVRLDVDVEEALEDLEEDDVVCIEASYNLDSRGFAPHIYVTEILSATAEGGLDWLEEDVDFEITELNRRDPLRKVVDRVRSEWADELLGMGGGVAIDSGHLIIDAGERDITQNSLKAVTALWFAERVEDELETEIDLSTLHIVALSDGRYAREKITRLVCELGFDYDPDNEEAFDMTYERIEEVLEKVSSVSENRILIHVSLQRDGYTFQGFIFFNQSKRSDKAVFLYLSNELD